MCVLACVRRLGSTIEWRTHAIAWYCRNFNSLVKQSAASERKDMMEAPELRTHVFCRVTEDIGAVPVDDSGWGTLPRVDRYPHMLQFKLVRMTYGDCADYQGSAHITPAKAFRIQIQSYECALYACVELYRDVEHTA